jgi:hypothetical protein
LELISRILWRSKVKKKAQNAASRTEYVTLVRVHNTRKLVEGIM